MSFFHQDPFLTKTNLSLSPQQKHEEGFNLREKDWQGFFLQNKL